MSSGALRRYVPANKDVKELAGTLKTPVGIAADDKYVYWTEKGSGSNDGAVRRANLDGTMPVYIGKAQASPTSVAVDNQYVYWTSNIANGQVLRTSK